MATIIQFSRDELPAVCGDYPNVDECETVSLAVRLEMLQESLASIRQNFLLVQENLNKFEVTGAGVVSPDRE